MSVSSSIIHSLHPFYIFPTMNDVMGRLVYITHHLKHGSLVHIKQSHNADDFFLTRIIGRVDQLDRRTLLSIALFHPRAKLLTWDFTEAMMGRNKFRFRFHTFLFVFRAG